MAVTSGSVRAGADAVGRGGLVVLPTDTVYGIGARPDDRSATAAIFAAKGRDRSVALPVLLPDPDVAGAVACLDARARALADAYWPGALTLVLPRAARASRWDLGGDPSTVGVRVPAHPVARALLAITGPLAVTSANASGEPPATTCDDLQATFGDRVAVYLCEDEPLVGEASTVVDLTGVEAIVLRAGGVGADELRRLLPPGEALLDSPPSP